MQTAVYRGLSLVLSALPETVCYSSARALGSLMAVVPNVRRQAVRANLAVVYGCDPHDRCLRRDTRRALQHALLNYVDLFRLARPDAVQRIRQIFTPSLKPLDDALAQGRGVVIVSAHLGNLDTVVHKLALRGDRVLIPVEPLEPPSLLRFLTAQRTRFGTQIEPIGPDTFKHMVAHLRSGGIVVVVSDRDVQGSGQAVTFFGQSVSMANAGLVLSLRTGAPVVVAFGYRHRNNRISAHFPPVQLRSGKERAAGRSTREELDTGMRALAQLIEAEIRQDPGQWVVQQPVFAPGRYQALSLSQNDRARETAANVRVARGR